MGEPIHRFLSACRCVYLASGSSKFLAPSGSRQRPVFPVDQETYSANPIPPFEHPVTSTTFDSVPAGIFYETVTPEMLLSEDALEKLGWNERYFSCCAGGSEVLVGFVLRNADW